jgi:hypothetical protein
MGKAHQYKHLLGMEKVKIKDAIGQEFNYYSFDIWTYLLDTNWFGRKTYLVIIFKDDIVVDVQINRRFYFRGMMWNTAE